MKSTTEADETANEEQHDGFNVVDEVPPDEWANYDTEPVGEFVHIITDPQSRELRCYLTVNEDFPNERVKTTIENVKIRAIYNDDLNRHQNSEAKRLRGFYLTSRHAETFRSFVDLLAHSRKLDSEAALSWYENNAKPSHVDQDVKDETITLAFRNLFGQQRVVQIQDSWRTESNQMAKYEEDQ